MLGVTETPVNLFRMKVQSSSADARRASFNFRSPAGKLLLNPKIYYQADFVVTVPQKYSKMMNMASIQQKQDTAGGQGLAALNDIAGGVDPGAGLRMVFARTDGPAISLGEGNTVTQALESIQWTINGCSVSHANLHLFQKSLYQTDIPADVAQRCFSKCGGSWNKYDEKCVKI